MTLKITLKPVDDSPPFVNIGSAAQVIDLESGIDISKCVRNIEIKLYADEWVTAILECDVGELELTGVDVEKVIPIEIKKGGKVEKEYIYKEGLIKRKIITITK